MRHWLGRRRASQDHPGLKQVDKLLSGNPDQLKVPVSGLPGQVSELLSFYEGLFKRRNYRVIEVDRRVDDLWIAHIERTKQRHQGVVRGSV
ncbi:MAG: hypothetical protein M3290_09010 [Actinomycetota bacterium]|nr:hypothetical protein [Actinomycetota bacterium]